MKPEVQAMEMLSSNGNEIRNVHVLTPLLLSIVLTLFLYFKSRRPRNMPPGPKALPFIGNLNLIYKNRQIHITTHELGKKYSGLYSFQFGQYPGIVINDYDTLRETLISNADVFSDRPMHMDFIKTYTRGKGIFMQNGQVWKVLRKLVVKAMRGCTGEKACLEDQVREEVFCTAEQLQLNMGRPYEIQQLLYKAIANNICSVLFGKRSDYSDPDFSRMVQNLYLLFSTGGFANIFLYLPWYTAPLMPFVQPNLRGLLQAVFQIEKYIKKQVKCHRETFDSHNLRDFVDFYLDAEKQDSKNRLYSDQQIFQLIMDLFMAGAETTCTTLLWALMYLSKYPHIQDKCRAEIKQVLGSARSPEYKDRCNMPYIEATICEVQRMGNVTPLSVFHSTAREFTYRGYNLPKNTIVLTNLYSIHMDPKHWKNPEEFNPERFLDENGRLKTPSTFIPFGIGRRTCLGEHLAKMELFLFLTTILQNFKIDMEDLSQCTDLKDANFGMTLGPRPYRIVVSQT